jgi:transcriptional regulator with XRE-family HTH domain
MAGVDDLGEKIRKIRIEKGLTIAELSEITHLSASMISQVENNKSLPSLKTLEQFSIALKVPIGALFESQEGTHSPIIKQSERQRLRTRHGVTFYLLTPNVSEHDIEALYNVYKPHGHTGPLYSHHGEECGIVIKGKFEVLWNNQVFIIEEGDTIYLDSSKPHKITNLSDEEAIAIWINSPPTW